MCFPIWSRGGGGGGGRELVMIAPVPGHCLPFALLKDHYNYNSVLSFL